MLPKEKREISKHESYLLFCQLLQFAYKLVLILFKCYVLNHISDCLPLPLFY